MKLHSLLLATSVLAATAGVAAAEVTLSGDARMGITNNNSANDWQFTSRARVKFTMSGTTDGGLEFGASFRANNATSAANGTAGEVYISGAFGRLAMGDVDGAAQAAVGQVDGVGLTGLGDQNEIDYALGEPDPSMLYSYTTGQMTFYLSAEQPADGTGGTNDAYGAGFKWATDQYSFAIGYEDDGGIDVRQTTVGGSVTFSGVTLKAIYADSNDLDGDQYAFSASGTFSGVGVTAFYNEDLDGETAYGLGASYDLGGGAKVMGGVVDSSDNDTVADFGVSFSF
ncbi:MAG: porin [Rhodobacteraceae bacterium]|nr:porin [Paracoccaceae bacterium]